MAWVYIKAQRALYVDRGRDVILCDRLQPGEVELVLRIDGPDIPAAIAELTEALKQEPAAA